jgi:hypothetical protein
VLVVDGNMDLVWKVLLERSNVDLILTLLFEHVDRLQKCIGHNIKRDHVQTMKREREKGAE